MDDSTAPTALEELARLARRASQELDRAIATCLGESSVARWHVLAAVVDGVGHPMSHLAEATLLTGANLTRLIDGMISDNLVHRKVDDTDRRRVLVFPTRRGLLAYQGMNRAISESRLDELGTSNGRLARSLATMVDQLRAEPATT
ncbi:MarR family winged helix-turn-helix transcriptional regulator [Nocardia iowensis]|uniref:MarR family transcriptional regulator n=1 Tax=Nocardia iowensis TaxID=204891 RepID=A0ABX8RN67_NOCIO|nr:MarR family transcriptional regulator [Nocardia iowensis]QXN90432.1 MarR family transcriptional regulator [Nocardia iowensis]